MVIDLHGCRSQKTNGEPCRATPMRGKDFCFWHSPEHSQEAAEARRRFSPLHHVFEELGRCASPMNC